MKILITLCISVAAIFSHLQTRAQFTWNFTNTSPTGTIPNLTAGIITRLNNNTNNPSFLLAGAPASTNTYVGASGGNNGNASVKIGAINTTTSTYVQVTLTPAANFWVNVSAIKWGNYSISSTGPVTLSIYTSLDNYTSPVTTVAAGASSTWNLLNPTISPINGLTSVPLTLRIYATDGTGTTPAAGVANWRIDDLVITASAQSGTAGNIPKYTSPTTFGNSIMAEYNGKIGVGTTTPTYKLDVAGNLKTTQDANINGLVVGKGASAGIYSTAVGVNALNLTTASQNTAVGWGAGSNITTGNLNTAVGYGAMYSSTVGGGSIAIGAYAMQNWVGGNYNIGIGYDALHGAGAAFGNIGIGRNVMGGTITGSYNVGLGYASLLNLTSGANNVVLGQMAGNILTTGSNNILIGASANASNAAAINELNIGNWIYGANGNIGVGVSTPQNKLEITHGTAGNSGLRFTNLTSSSTAAASSGKVLAVNANGDVVLELGGGGSIPDGSETKIIAGTNVTITGNGTVPTPYIINSTSGPSNWVASGLDANSIINSNTGAVIIGTNITSLPAGYKLYVADGILAEKVKVALKTGANWADHVFSKDYTLKPLSEVEAFIKTNKHLPGIQSAQTLVTEGGIDVAQMFAKQMEKIEELTLYVIDLNKKLEKIEKENKALKSMLSTTNQK